jgi:hypothetical protein
MSLRLNWKKITKLYDQLKASKEDSTNVVFIIMLSDGKIKKNLVKLKDFLKFFWSLSENKEIKITNLVVQDLNGATLYRHSQQSVSNEEIPAGGNSAIVKNWKNIKKQDRQTYIEILISQFYAYEK